MRTVLVAFVLLAGCDPFPGGAALDARDEPFPRPDARPVDAAIDAGVFDGALCFRGVDQGLDACANGRPACDAIEARPGGQRLAQTFRPAQTGALTSLRLWLTNADKLHTRVNVSIVDLTGNPDVLLSSKFDVDAHTIASAEIAASDELVWNDVAFAMPPHVDAEQPYAIAVRAVGGTQPVRWVTAVNPNDPYPRGKAYSRGGRDLVYAPITASEDFVFEARVVTEVCR